MWTVGRSEEFAPSVPNKKQDLLGDTSSGPRAAAGPGSRAWQAARAGAGLWRWTIKAAIDDAVPAQVVTAALYERFSSRGEADFANRVFSAMRYEFGGHIEKPAG